ncbi:hypothetical protein KSP40_PGU007982 [Platanthera guangdongensis]|uniref:Methyltransferase type 11 domain-containing protein n=1 Tax=Platanthera guangdongensis TaxID=2320717 RepID=A0ABR2LX43_9ASPA
MGLTRSAVLKILIAATASMAAALLLLDLAAIGDGSGGCDSSVPVPLGGAMELDSAFRELISLGWLASGDRAIFVGPDAIGAAIIARRKGLPETVAAPATACCALPFDGESFDFAFSASLDRARVPARVVLEMERVLRPGRVGAIFRLRPISSPARPEGLMRAAAPVASLLRFSDVIGARALNGSAIVAFRKRRRGGAGSGDTECSERTALMPRIIGDLIDLARAALAVGMGSVVMVTEIIGG